MIIALTGRKESGKDTVASYIENNYHFKRYSFAEPIKRLAMFLFDWTWEQCNDKILKETVDPAFGFSPRHFLQWFGTDVFQKAINERFPDFAKLVGRRFWVDKFVKFYNANGGVDENFVISDLRFQHEIDAVCALEERAYIVKVSKPNVGNSDTHESESAVDAIKEDILLDNNGSFDHLYSLIEDMIDTLCLLDDYVDEAEF